MLPYASLCFRKFAKQKYEDCFKEIMRVVLLHGAYGSPAENWFPSLRAELEARGIPCVSPRFPTPEGQTPVAWKEVLDAERILLDEETVIVAHSLGPLFALHLLEEPGIPILGAFFVAPFLGPLGNRFDAVNKPFFKQFDTAAILRRLPHAWVYASDNDPFVPLALSRSFAHEIHAPVVVIKNAGHFNAAAGYRAFPELLAALDELRKTQR